jgi:hypothetical protein
MKTLREMMDLIESAQSGRPELRTWGNRSTGETKEKMSISAKRREDKRRADGWTMPVEAKIRAVATRQERIKSGQINPYSKDRNQKMAQSKKGTKRQYLPDGSFVMVKV